MVLENSNGVNKQLKFTFNSLNANHSPMYYQMPDMF